MTEVMCAFCGRREPITPDHAREQGWYTHRVITSGEGQHKRVVDDSGVVCPKCIALFPDIDEDARTA